MITRSEGDLRLEGFGSINWLKDRSSARIFKIMKTYDISASHHLSTLPDTHPCSRVHGHNYKIYVYAKGKIKTPEMWIVDFGDMDKEVKPIIKKIDHVHLNPHIDVPTCEMVALWILEQLPDYVYKVRVSETDKTFGEVER